MRNSLSALLLTAITFTATACKAPAPHTPEPQPAGNPMTSIDTLHPEPPGFLETHVGAPDYPIPPYARFLAGVKICLDPGHGGDAHKAGYKRGPTGVREAEMNFRVARYLAALLEAAGAEVLLTRDGDVEVSLAERAALANEWNADIFVSLHHNAIGNKPHVNYTTVWYHAGVDQHPSNLDLARYLYYGLCETLALPQITTVPLKSDQLMYEAGFGILRNAEVTAALCETSFFTNPEEEQRLRDPEYNFLEAYGQFLGLARYAAGGLPRATLLDPTTDAPQTGAPAFAGGERMSIPPNTPTLLVELHDDLRSRKAWGHDRQMILADTIAARIDGTDAAYTFSDDGDRYLLEVELPTDLAPGPHTLEVHFQNMYKNSVLNPIHEFAIE